MAEPIIIDNGSSTIKASLAGDDSPRVVFPSVAGVPRHTGVMVGWPHQHDFMVGEEALRRRGILGLKYPINCGIVSDWDFMEKIWHHTFYNELAVESRKHAVLLTEPPFNPKTHREKTSQIMFETLDVPAMFLALPSVLSVYASGRTTGIVLDSGADSTVAVPIYEGYALPHAISQLSFGGSDLFVYFLRLICERQTKTCSCGLERCTLLDPAHKLAYVAQNFNQELELAKKIPASFDEIYELPCGHFMTFGSEKFQYPEPLFQPSLIDPFNRMGLFKDRDVVGVHEMIFNSIMKCDIDIKKRMFENIMLTGGSTLFPGFVDRITKEIMVLGSSTLGHSFVDLMDREIKHSVVRKKFKVIAPPNRIYNACIGGSVLASLSTFKQMCI